MSSRHASMNEMREREGAWNPREVESGVGESCSVLTFKNERERERGGWDGRGRWQWVPKMKRENERKRETSIWLVIFNFFSFKHCHVKSA